MKKDYWDFLYEAELELNNSIGCKERFVILTKVRDRLFNKTDSLKILDGAGCRFTSYILKNIFPDSFIVSVNISGTNDVADITINADLADNIKIAQLSNNMEFDLIFLGEVFEHLFKPANTLKSLIENLKPKGHIIITTPNLANVYNRILLLLGNSLYNYRPTGILPSDDHVTVITKKQMIDLLHNCLGLDIVYINGYSYFEQRDGLIPENVYARSGRRIRNLRKLINILLPMSFREGLLYIARKK